MLKDYEYYRTENGVIYHGDCLQILDLVPCAFDLAFTDPPYNVGKQYDGYDDNLSDGAYLMFIKSFISALKAKTDNKCVFYPPKKYALEFWNECGKEYKQIILTHSTEGAIRGKFVTQHSFLLTSAPPLKRCKDVWHNVQFTGMGYFFKEDTHGHPGYTSEDVTNRVIDIFTKDGQSVIDCFGGTGTTGVICERQNRKYVLIEQSEKYCAIAKKRIEEEAMQIKMF